MTQKLVLPGEAKRLLLHVCCAPCSGGIVERLLADGIDTTIFFYNPNIHPREEYEKRKAEVREFAESKSVPCFDGDYDTTEWFKRIAGLEAEYEGGARCTKCFDLRMERTALFAHENGFPLFATSLGISRWKNLDQVNSSGEKAASTYPDVAFWDCNWRKGGGMEKMTETTRREDFYRQDYCGCVFSLVTARDKDKPLKNKEYDENDG